MITPKFLGNQDRTKKRRKRSDLMKKFNINSDQFDMMVIEQNGVCAICKKEEICKRDLCVDHCHLTSRIRGLLCTNCNMALGKFQDNIEYLHSAIEYLSQIGRAHV